MPPTRIRRRCSAPRRSSNGSGHHATATAVDLAQVTEAIAREDPELSVVSVHNDDEHALDLVEEITAFAAARSSRRYGRGPRVRPPRRRARHLARRSATETRGAQSAIEIALRRHADTRRLTEQVDRLESALERRALIERAKGILMERHGSATGWPSTGCAAMHAQ